jgi:hypothetical protein
MKTVFAALIALSLTACGKKVENAPAPVSPQVTDAVTQTPSPVVAADAGVVAPTSALVQDPAPKPVEAPAVQSVPEAK